MVDITTLLSCLMAVLAFVSFVMLSTSHPEQGLTLLTMAAVTGVFAAGLSAFAPLWLAIGAWALTEGMLLYAGREYYAIKQNALPVIIPAVLATAVAGALAFFHIGPGVQLISLGAAAVPLSMLRVLTLLRAGGDDSTPRHALIGLQLLYVLYWAVVMTMPLYSDNAAYSVGLLLLGPAVILLINALLWPQLHAMRLRNRINRLARFDALTGLLNRRGFEEAVHRELRRRSRQQSSIYALILIDYDRFRTVNARYGHAAGDLVIQHGVKYLRLLLNNERAVIGRIGGDSYGVLYPCEDGHDARQWLVDVREQMRAWSVDCGEMTIPVSASASLALYPHDGGDFESLYRVAMRQLVQVQGPGAALISTLAVGDAEPVVQGRKKKREQSLPGIEVDWDEQWDGIDSLFGKQKPA
ncbi:Diguanylate cyclase, GGDEF domain [Andreprevotia lacus DSM 23236]|jgi:diguanylate cyclase (GGDEF)-like protein|uniref:diguanylate cyclase n=1 Tax=Andreprevotia lacus DSM 23236 TaxID=1121001 RepID=A0A1W1XUD4_9NEIS|nr:GGDEF domain-containing protein [Andreprevotia lacus]SMC27472.1 Diguanylate cyclase, GGDEF domain [Andreprevotia lacus DSM 23236]